MAVHKGSKPRLKDREIKRIIAYYQNCNSLAETAREFSRSVSTIKKYIDNARKYDANFTKEIETIKKNNGDEILASISDDKTLKIITKYKDLILEPNNMALQVEKGLQFFINAIGMLYDKQIKLEELKLKRDALQLNSKIFETYTPENDELKKVMAKKINQLASVDFAGMVEKESLKKEDV